MFSMTKIEKVSAILMNKTLFFFSALQEAATLFSKVNFH